MTAAMSTFFFCDGVYPDQLGNAQAEGCEVALEMKSPPTALPTRRTVVDFISAHGWVYVPNGQRAAEAQHVCRVCWGARGFDRQMGRAS